jgi:hypothetical protein
MELLTTDVEVVLSRALILSERIGVLRSELEIHGRNA